MRKLKLQMNMSLDGFVGGPNGELDWMLPEEDPAQVDLLQDLTNSVDLILLGRKMAEISVPHWEKVAAGTDQNPEIDFARFFVHTPKLVFSRSMKKMEGENLTIVSGSLNSLVKEMKSKGVKDIIVYGGANFVSGLLADHLIDELFLFIHPVAIANGLPVFTQQSGYKLISCKAYSNGIVLHQYAMAD